MVYYREVMRLARCSHGTVQRYAGKPGFPKAGSAQDQADFITRYRRDRPVPAGQMAISVDGDLPLGGDLKQIKLAVEIKRLQQQLSEDRQRIYDQAVADMRSAIEWSDEPLREALARCKLSPEQSRLVNDALDSVRRRWTSGSPG
jgi:hypothetical protein